ncbi:hypothetical protein CERZMDRAFT_84413 [Cercospora zeae-maydis SCOH1-5]|uniref:RING-type domain-containing protein n=1 Tax=Cercospora zeae-maydis SCOH1-5 TaxID=717836 RepID=A0A6A6FHM9_9PEZI|nr:hypothetical protein CERZMDRAFT_84413 [Cercospora zeae-maydis SCOH1-5]
MNQHVESALGAYHESMSPPLIAAPICTVRPGTTVLVRREDASYRSSSLLMVRGADQSDGDLLNSIRVQVIPTSRMNDQLRDHLIQIEDADDVLRSHQVLQSLATMAQGNGWPVPLSQFVGLEDRVFPHPSGGAIRKYLLDDACPDPLCRNGYRWGREQIYQAYPFLQAGLRPDVLHWYLAEVRGSPMLCLSCYGFRTVRRDERTAIAALMINTGKQPPTVAVAQRIYNHRSFLSHVLQPLLGHHAADHISSNVQYSAETGSSRSSDEIGPSSGENHSAASFAPLDAFVEQNSQYQQTSSIYSHMEGPTRPSLGPLNATLRGGGGSTTHPDRRSTPQQLESIRGRVQGRSTRTPTPSTPHSANLTPAQLAGRAARHRYNLWRAQQAAESQASQSSPTTSPRPSSTHAAIPASRPASGRTAASTQQPPRAALRAPSSTAHQPSRSSRASATVRTTSTDSSTPRAMPQPPTQPYVTQWLSTIPETTQPSTLRLAPISNSFQQQQQHILPNSRRQQDTTPAWHSTLPHPRHELNNNSDWQPIPPGIFEEMQQGNPSIPTHRQAIQDMAKSRFKNWIQRNRQKADGKCPICLCAWGDSGGETYILTTLCGHDFHEDCVLEWFKTNNGCPVCRAKQE